ncbi:MAG: hypothetical protein KDC95_15085 [Planctomycetes bacterium]|nr:hypothetical protein [Planctomycetota bacterium]
MGNAKAGRAGLGARRDRATAPATREGIARLAERVRQHGFRVDARLAILDLLSLEDDPTDLRDELDARMQAVLDAERRLHDDALGK